MKALGGVLAGLVLLAAGCGRGGGDEVTPLPEGRFIATKHTLRPEVQLFAEPVVARVEILVDTERFDPDRIRIEGFFEPYEQDGATVRTRRDQGRYTHLRFELRLRCLVYQCLPHTGDEEAPQAPTVGTGALPAPAGVGEVRDRKTHKLRPARIVYDDPEKGPQRVRNISWPQIVSVSRLNFSDRDVSVIGFPFEAAVTPLPAATYRISPSLAGLSLLAGALALLALPASLVARTLRRKPPPIVEEEPDVPPLEQALQLVEWAREREAGDRREALEVLAGELDDETPELAEDARRLAWSREQPSADALEEVVRRVREADEASG
jgi:hypothetical protein